jgi:hypothetical protein
MGRIKQGILGGFSGKVGGVIGSSWKGLAVVKSMPLSVANPKTALQVAHRANMAGIIEVAKLLLAVILKPLWDRFASGMSGYNAFVSENLSKFTAGVMYQTNLFTISKGKMSSTTPSSVTASNGSATIVVNWTNDAGADYKLATDLAYVVIYNITTNKWSSSGGSIARSVGSLSLTALTACATSDILHAYLAFKRVDGTIVSNTGHLAKTV